MTRNTPTIVRRATALRGVAWIGVVLTVLSTPLTAQTAAPKPAPATSARADGPAWSTLTPAQQRALEPLKADWASIDASRKAKWLEVAAKLPTLPAAEQERIRQRMVEWSRMTPAERGQARLQFQETRQFSEADRRARWDTYQAFPDETKRALANLARPPVVAKAPVTGTSANPSTSTAAGNGGAKRNVVPVTTPGTTLRPVAPTVVQAKPGATTTLVTRPAAPPLHQQPGLPKIAATQGFVNPSTLLPQRGPQGAATLLQPVPVDPPAAPATAASSPAAAAGAEAAAPAASAASQP